MTGIALFARGGCGLPIAALGLLLLTACQTGRHDAAAPAGTEIGTLHTAGPNVTVNSRPVPPGTAVISGDTVATGPRSSALIALRGGGLVQLDQNTDPLFRRLVETVSSFGECVMEIVVGFGQVYVETEGQPICTSFGAWTTVARTRFNLQFVPPRAVLTVVDGQVTLRQPQQLAVGTATQAVLSGDRVVEVRPVTPLEIQQILAWRDNYRLESRPPPSRSAPPDFGPGIIPGFPGGFDFGWPRRSRGPRGDGYPKDSPKDSPG